MSYWDTSALVKLFVKEADSIAFEQHLLALTSPALIVPSPPVISRIGIYEIHAVFHRKESEGALPTEGAEILYKRITQDVAAGKIAVVDINSDIEQEYRRILISCFQNKPAMPMRTLDAIHLATARFASESEIVATDKRLRDAAKMLGFSLFPA
jgi:predicted nucleic acid-binding protein